MAATSGNAHIFHLADQPRIEREVGPIAGMGPPNTTFRLRVLVRLSPGIYTLTATQSCSGPDGAGAGQATTKLTVT